MFPTWRIRAEPARRFPMAIVVRCPNKACGKPCRIDKQPISGLIFSPDGRRLAALSPTQYQGKSERRTVTKLVPTIERRVRTVVRDGKDVQETYDVTVYRQVTEEVMVTVTTAVGGGVTVWETTTFAPVLSLPRQGTGGLAAAFSSDGERLALAAQTEDANTEDEQRGPAGEIKIWDIASRKELLTLPCDEISPCDVCFSPDGRRLAATAGQRVKVWDAKGELLFTLSARRQFFEQLSYSPDGERLVTVGRAGTHMEVRTWDAADGTELMVVERFPAITRGLDLIFASDHRRVLFACKDEHDLLQLWAWDGKSLETRLPLPKPPPRVWPWHAPHGAVMPDVHEPKTMPGNGEQIKPQRMPKGKRRAAPRQGSVVTWSGG